MSFPYSQVFTNVKSIFKAYFFIVISHNINKSHNLETIPSLTWFDFCSDNQYVNQNSYRSRCSSYVSTPCWASGVQTICMFVSMFEFHKNQVNGNPPPSSLPLAGWGVVLEEGGWWWWWWWWRRGWGLWLGKQNLWFRRTRFWCKRLWNLLCNLASRTLKKIFSFPPFWAF